MRATTGLEHATDIPMAPQPECAGRELNRAGSNGAQEK